MPNLTPKNTQHPHIYLITLFTQNIGLLNFWFIKMKLKGIKLPLTVDKMEDAAIRLEAYIKLLEKQKYKNKIPDEEIKFQKERLKKIKK